MRLSSRYLLVWPASLYSSFLPVIGGVSIESCSACPAGHYCSTEGLSNPSGPCAVGFYCPFDFSSTTPYAFLCPKVRIIHTMSHSFLFYIPALSLNYLSSHFLIHCSYCLPNIISQSESYTTLFIKNVIINEYHPSDAPCHFHSLLGPLLSRSISPGFTLSHRRVPTKPRFRFLHSLPTWILLWGGHRGRTISLPTTLILPCRYVKNKNSLFKKKYTKICLKHQVVVSEEGCVLDGWLLAVALYLLSWHYSGINILIYV